MQPKITRRALTAGLAAMPVLAQAPKPQAPAPAKDETPPAADAKSPDEEARENIERNSNVLRKTKVPIMLEPTFAFRP